MLEIELNLKKRRTHTHTQKTGCECVSILAMIVLMWVTRIAVSIHFALRVNRPTLFFFFFCLFWVQGRRMLSHHRLFHDDDAQHTQMEWNGGRFPIDICILLALFYYYRRGKKRSNYGERKKLFFFFVRWMNAHCCSFLYPAADFKSRECLPAIHTHSNGFTPIIIDRPSRVLDNSIALIPVSSFFTWNFFVVFIFLVFFVLRMTFFFCHGKCSASFSRPVRRADGTLRPSSFPLAHLIWVENRKKKKNYI